MTNELQIRGKQEFLGVEIPIIEGGFGNDKRVVTAPIISQIHNSELKVINQSIKRLIDKNRIKEGIDYLDVKGHHQLPLNNFGWNGRNIANAFVLSERGYSKLIKYMDDDKSWDIMERFIDEYFVMRQVINSNEQLKASLLLAIYEGGQSGIMASRELSKIEVKEATKPLLDKIEEDKPKVEFTEVVLKSSDNILVRELAKIATDEGIKIGQNNLYKKLREWGYIFKNGTEPYQHVMDKGYFVVKETASKTPYGVKLNKTTLVTPLGQVKIIEKLRKELTNVA